MVGLKQYIKESLITEDKFIIHSENSYDDGVEAKFYTPKETIVIGKNNFYSSVRKVLGSGNAVNSYFDNDDALSIIGLDGDSRTFVLFKPKGLSNHISYNRNLSKGKYVFAVGLSDNSKGYKDQYTTWLVDLNKGLIYWLDREKEEDDKLIFDKKGMKIRYMKSYDKGMLELNNLI